MNRILSLLKRFKGLYGGLVRLATLKRFSSAYRADARLAARQAMPPAAVRNFNRYRVMMLAHYLEKGMCYPDPRPFGQRHVSALLELLPGARGADLQSFEYLTGLSILFGWRDFFVAHGWREEALLPRVEAFLRGKAVPEVPSGSLRLEVPSPRQAGWTEAAGEWLLARHSARDFSPAPLQDADLQYALRCFSRTPSACNRQMCRVYRVVDPGKRDLLNRSIDGIGGLNRETLNHFVITFDLAAQSNARERNQGFLNAGLAAMNFANGLHLSGIGNCLVQWDKTEQQDAGIREALGLPRGERIAVIICAGYYPDSYTAPRSARRPLHSVYRVL